MAEFPPTIIVVHPKERRSKCTVEPLRGRPGFVFWKFPEPGPEPLEGYVRLGLGGALLTPAESGRGLLVLDGTWRLAARMEATFIGLPVRSLLPWRTAYPRVSKQFEDPAQGLATVEAIFAAFQQMGRPTNGLLEGYRWKDRFQELNAGLVSGCKNSPQVVP